MATVLFAWELGGGLGHVAVIRPLAARLTQLGHRVVVAARDLLAAKRTLGSLGVPLLQAPARSQPVRDRVEPPSTYPDLLHNSGLTRSGEAESALAAWRSLFDLVAPDAVV